MACVADPQEIGNVTAAGEESHDNDGVLIDAYMIPHEDLVDDIVPEVSYEDSDDKRSSFTKSGRVISHKRAQFPTIFCALLVRIRLQSLDAQRSAKDISKMDVERILRSGFGLADSLVRWDDDRGSAANGSESIREVLVGLRGDLPNFVEVGSDVRDEDLGMFAQIVEVTETCDDIDVDRMNALARCFKGSGNSDAIVFELPQLWIIPDPDFRAKHASIGLYPGSFWMGFLKSWGPVTTAEVFFRTAPANTGEALVHLVVKYRDRECMKMCFTFLHDRYLVHPTEQDKYRAPRCRLINFEDFKASSGATGGSKLRASTKPRGKVAAKPLVPRKAEVPVAKATPAAPKSAETVPDVTPTAKETPTTPSKSAPTAPQGPPPEPTAELSDPAAADSVAAGPIPSQVEAESLAAAGAMPKATQPSRDEASTSTTSAADGERTISGKELEGMMSRMERLEKENQELMQILLQMQGLLKQQQQRNARLTKMLNQDPSTSASAPSPGAEKSVSAVSPAAALAATGASGRSAKRRAAEALANSPGALGGPGDVATGEEAPWKGQRKRQRKTPRSSNHGATSLVAETVSGRIPAAQVQPAAAVAAAMVPSAKAPMPPATAVPENCGLTAYHNALLGV